MNVKVAPAPRGESESYLAIMLVGMNAADEVVWCEGIRKDRDTMYPEYSALVDAYITTEGVR